MAGEQRVHLVVDQVGVQRRLRQDARDDGERRGAPKRRQPDEQHEAAEHQRFSHGAVEIPVQATISTTVTATRCSVVDAFAAAQPIAKNQNASIVNHASRPRFNPRMS